VRGVLRASPRRRPPLRRLRLRLGERFRGPHAGKLVVVQGALLV
jgi:hypothetical protein